MKEFTIGKNDAGQRLDKYLTKALPSLRAAIQKRGLEEKTTIVSDCGLPSQSIHTIMDEDIKSYFSTVLIKP